MEMVPATHFPTLDPKFKRDEITLDHLYRHFYLAAPTGHEGRSRVHFRRIEKKIHLCWAWRRLSNVDG